MDGGDASLGEEACQRVASQRDDDPGVDGGDLAGKIARTSGDLLRLELMPLRQAMLDHIGEVDLSPAESGQPQELVEKDTRGAGKWGAAAVVVVTRCLTNEHDLSL